MDKPIRQILRAFVRAHSAQLLLLALALTACKNPVAKEVSGGSAQKPKQPTNSLAPVISSISDVTINQDETVTVNYTITDTDSTLDCRSSIYLSNSNQYLLPVTYMVKSGTAPNCRLQLTPAAGYWGSATVRIQAYDGQYSTYRSFNLNVNEGDPTAVAANASANEGSNVTFTVQLTQASPLAKTVTYATSNGTATAGVNYTATSGTLVFAAGETSKTITVPTINDNVHTANLTFGLTLTAVGVTSSATGTVTNTNSAPTASAANVSANEGSNLTFTVDLNRASAFSTSVTYATANGTALAGTNYTSASGALTFAAGETSKTVTVTSLSDGVHAANLNFELSLTANSTTNTSTGTVVNTDGAPTASASNVSANEGSNLVFTVTLDRSSASSTAVTYATSNGTGAAGTNYTSTSGTLTFAAGETSKTLNVPSLNDGTYASDLTFTLSLTASTVTNTATGTVVNTHAAPTASAANASANEGSNITFTVNLNRPSSTSTSVTYATSDGSALDGTNYTDTSGTLTFAAGETSKTLNVPTTDDNVHAGNLTFTLSLTANATTNNATGTVNNVNPAPTATASNVSANEGSNLTFTVNLNRASSSSTSVTYATSNGTAAAGTNYTAASGTLTFLAGETSKTVSVTSLTDGVHAADLIFTLSLTANATTNTATGTIVNTDAAPTASAANASANEGSNVTFTVNLNRASTSSTSVTYATSNGTGTAGTNYTSASGTLTFAAGETSKTINVSSIDDNVHAGNLTFTLSLTANAVTNTATGTVNNTNTAPTASAANASANEGSNITFTVNLNRSSTSSTSVTYATSDGTALEGTNYTDTSGTLTFAAGETSKTVSVPTTDDGVHAGSLTFTLSMTANAVTNTATGTITNTNSAPTASAANVSANEGSNLTFTVDLNRASTSSTTVAYATVGDSAFAGANYTATSGNLVFAAGETSKTVSVTSLVDNVHAGNLTFNLNLTANAVTNTAVGTIINTDTAPTASASNASANEGSNLTFTVNLNRTSSGSTSVTYATSDVTATAGTNYTSASGTLTFAAGESSKTVSVTSTNDGVHTGNLTFTLSMTANATTNTATGTVTNTNAAPTASAANASANEGSDLTFTVNLSRASSSSTSVTYATSNGTGAAGTNYTSASGTLTFNAGETSKTVTVSSLADSVYATDLTFTLSTTANATTNTATGTIVNTDTAPTASASNVSANEGSTLTFTVNLNRASSTSTSVTYTTVNGTALAGTNFTAASGTLTYTAGQTSKTVVITSLNDSTYTPNRTFTLEMTANATTNSATGTVVNTDATPTISITADASSVTEGNNAGFTLTLNRASSSNVQVDYTTVNGTASSTGDFTTTSGTATVTAGSLTTTISVPTIDDNNDEQDEAFSVSISNPQNASLGTASANETIQDTTLYYSFLSGSLPSGLTFSRPSSATYYDSSGVLQTAASGTARFDHNPSGCVGSCVIRGLLIEESRTNLLLQSGALGTTWISTNVSITNNSLISPNAGTNAETLTSDTNSSANTDHIAQNVTLSASTSYVLSFFVKNGTASQSRFEISAFNSGTTGKTSTITWAGSVPGLSDGNVVALPDDWYRVDLPFSTNASDAGAATVSFYPADSAADNMGEVYVWGAQLEAGSQVSSYIATMASAVTRSGDSVSVNNFATWFNATAWTAILDFQRPVYETTSSTATPVIFSSCDDTSGGTCTAERFEAIHLPSDNTFRGRSYVGSANVASSDYTNAANLAGVSSQMGVSQTSAGELQTAFNGSAATASSTASKPTLKNLVLGAGGRSGAYSHQLQGHLRKFTYRARALSAAQLQAMTSD